MSILYHQPMINNLLCDSWVMNRKLGQLDATLETVRDGTFLRTNRSSAPPTPGAGTARVYFTDDELRLKLSTGGDYNIGSLGLYARIVDFKTQNTDGGSAVLGAWRIRDLNTIVTNHIGLTLDSNQVTLPAGTYRCRITAPIYHVDTARHRLYDTTGATTLVLSTSGSAANLATLPNVMRQLIQGRFTLAAESVLELQYLCNVSKATDGLGLACNFTTEVYSILELWQEPT